MANPPTATAPTTYPLPTTSAAVAGFIDHSLLNPTLTDEQLRQDIATVRKYPLASICIKPAAVVLGREAVAGTAIKVCTVVGFPHGTSLPAVKAFEAERAMDQGATEIDMVVNVGKVLGQDWAAVREDIGAVLKVVHARRAIIKVIFENDFLPSPAYETHKIRLCEICSELRVDFVKTSTGYGFVKNADGLYAYKGAIDSDLRLMRAHSAPTVAIKAAGGVRTLDDLLRVAALGVTRIGATATITMIEAARQRFGK
jgi:deoxyribose-phosphate aldolase